MTYRVNLDGVIDTMLLLEQKDYVVDLVSGPCPDGSSAQSTMQADFQKLAKENEAATRQLGFNKVSIRF